MSGGLIRQKLLFPFIFVVGQKVVGKEQREQQNQKPGRCEQYALANSMKLAVQKMVHIARAFQQENYESTMYQCMTYHFNFAKNCRGKKKTMVISTASGRCNKLTINR